LLALGLHGLLLLLPMSGSSDDSVPVADAALSESAEDDAILADPKLDTAPSAIENVALAAPKPTAPNPSATTVPPLGTVRPVPVAVSPANQRLRPIAPPAPRPVAPVAPSRPQSVPPVETLPDLSSSGQNSPRPTAQTNPAATSPAASATTPARSPAQTPTSQSNDPPSVASLVASASGKVSDSLRSLSAFFTEGLIYSAEGTDEASARQKRDAWAADIQRQASGVGVENVELISIDEPVRIGYPLAAPKEGRSLNRCLDPVPGNAEIGVLFDAQGDLVEQPKIFRSTGYKALNDEIVATVASYDDFPADRQSKAYRFEVAVEYDAVACVSLDALRRE
jgi:outer membrane biosynthesis protein TonB